MREKFSFISLASVVLAFVDPISTLAGSNQIWQGIETSHFAIYLGTANKDAGRAVLNRLETARIFFENNGLATGARGPQLHILALDSVQDSAVYRVNPAAYAFYQRTREGDFVVIRDLAPEHFPVAIHEYTHFVVEHAGLKLPLWLNEGLADLYSTVESHNSQAILGAAPCGREDILSTQRWLDWADLAAVDHDSPYYRQSEKMLLFYSQSWALVHMLALDAEYEAGFNRFLLAVSGGATTDQAMLVTYHKSLEQIGRDVKAYTGSKRMTTHVLNMDLRPPSLETKDIADAAQHAELALAEILAASPQWAPEGKSRLASLAMKYPDDPRPEESLGFEAMNAGRGKQAQDHFAVAVRHHSQNPEVWFRLAHLKLRSEGATEEVLDLLQRVVDADPDHYGARLELGFAAAKCRKYELAVQSLEGIRSVKPEHAYTVSYTLAYCAIEMQQGGKARLYAGQARKAAGTNKDREEVDGLLRYIDQESPVQVASR